MTNEPLRMQILNMIERGDISTGEGLRWLEALAKNQPTSASRGELDSDMPEADPDLPEPDFPDVETGAEGVAATILPPPSADHLPFDTARIRGWWVVPLWIGVGVTVLAGLLMYWANLSQGIGFWFACASVPFILGLLLIVLAVQSRTARWLYLRVEQPGTEWPRVIQFGLPLPLGLAAWLLRMFKGRIPGMPDVAVDDMLESLGRSATPETPFYIQVEDDNEAKKVEIYIG